MIQESAAAGERIIDRREQTDGPAEGSRLDRSNRLAAMPLPVAAAAASILILALALRLAGARGDLWLDEIWSLHLLERVRHAGEVFWAINHDNNHFLNSLFLHALGADAPPLLLRTMSVLLGTASVAAIGWAAARRGGAPAALPAMLLAAAAYPMVHFGSEARGYAGLLLFTTLALILAERALEGDRRAPLMLGGAVLAGLLSHLTMLVSAAGAAAWVALAFWRRGSSIVDACRSTAGIFRPALWATLGILAVIAAGSRAKGFQVGGIDPFTLPGFVEGYGGLVRLTLGLPSALPAWAALLALWGLLALAAAARQPRMMLLGGVMLVAIPLAMLAGRVPNTEFPRYFLFAAPALLLLVGDLFAAAWRAGPGPRVAATALLALALVGNASSLVSFFSAGRGDYAAAVALMTRNGPARYAADHPFRVPLVAGFHARKLSADLTYVPPEDLCAQRPDWLVWSNPGAPETITRGRGCALAFRKVSVYPAWGLSGATWTVYRRAD